MAGIDLKERRGTLKENYSVIAAFFPMKKKRRKKKKSTARYGKNGNPNVFVISASNLIVCYTAVFSVVTQRSSHTKNGCAAD